MDDPTIVSAARPVIELKALTKFYGNTRGIEDITLSISSGEILGFLGPNGAGKTTALRLLMGFLRPTSGTATLMGLDVSSESVAVRRHIGYLPGDPALYGNRNGEELLALALSARGIERAPLAAELIERLDVPMQRGIKNCSRGMRQKVALVLALSHDPDVLVLDEPTAGLDPLGQRALLDILRRLADSGRTVLLSSHVLSEVEQICDRVAILREGRLTTVDSLENLGEKKYRQLRVSFVGEPPVFDEASEAEIIWSHEDRMTVRVRGNVQSMLAALAKAQITDITIEEPSLEELFLDYYRDGEGS
jgi:ABC-2 type transport system ATP-binding protein